MVGEYGPNYVTMLRYIYYLAIGYDHLGDFAVSFYFISTKKAKKNNNSIGTLHFSRLQTQNQMF